MKGMSLILMIFIVVGIFYGYQISPKLTFYSDDQIQIDIIKPTFGEVIEGDRVEFQWSYSHPTKEQDWARLTLSKDGNVVYDTYTGGNSGSVSVIKDHWFIEDRRVEGIEDGDYILTIYCGYYADWNDTQNRDVIDIGVDTSYDIVVASVSEPITFKSPTEDNIPPPVPEIINAYRGFYEEDGVMKQQSHVEWTSLWQVSDLNHYNLYYGTEANSYSNVIEVPEEWAQWNIDTTGFDEVHVAVSAVDDWGNESDKSPDFHITEENPEPNPPPVPDPDVPIPNEGNRVPVASFSLNKTEFVVGDVVTCTSDSYDPDGDPLSYKWFFDGEEVTSFGQRVMNIMPSLAYIVVGSGKKEMQHKFEVAGTHVISLYVSDGEFGSHVSRTVTVFNSSVTNQENVGEQDWSNQNIVIERKKSIFEYLKDPIFFMIFTIVVVLFVYVVILRRKR